MKFILAVSQNHKIGIDGKLPWHIPHDLAYFKMMTYGQRIIMGRKTYESMPPLKDREYYVIGRDHHSIDNIPDGICIGGAQLFESLVKKGDILYLTHIMHRISDNAVGVRLPPRQLLWTSRMFEYKQYQYYFAAYRILDSI